MIIDVRSRKIIEQNQYNANIISITSQPTYADIKNCGPTLYLRFGDFDTELAAALMKYFNGDDSPIFDNPQYCPNMRCYRMVLEALMEECI